MHRRTILIGSLFTAASLFGITTASPKYSFLDEKAGQLFSTTSNPRKCDNGTLVTGTPSGVYRNISGINTYFAYPKDKKTDVAILMLSDIFGLPLVNNPLMADTLAAAGYFVVLPDLFYGNAVGVNDLNDPSFNISAWLLTHPESETQGVINATINTMKTSYGVEKVGGSGFCFGGKFVIDYLASGDITLDAGYVAHPSGALPADYQTVSRPLSIAWGELDTSNPSDSRAAAELTLTTIDANYQTSLYADVEHGFSTRTNLTNPRNQFAQESAFLQNIRWFDVWLK